MIGLPDLATLGTNGTPAVGEEAGDQDPAGLGLIRPSSDRPTGAGGCRLSGDNNAGHGSEREQWRQGSRSSW